MLDLCEMLSYIVYSSFAMFVKRERWVTDTSLAEPIGHLRHVGTVPYRTAD